MVAILLALVASLPVRGQEEMLGPAPEDSFTVIVIPDTQSYRGQGTKAEPKSVAPVTNGAFESHMRWIVGNLQRQRIVFVSHVGDIVDRNTTSQWSVARACMDRLHGRVPYGISPGNHDMKTAGDASLFQHYFPASRFKDFSWYAGSYRGPDEEKLGNNVNSCQLFSAGGMDFVFLHLACNAPDEVLNWANETLRAHANRRALITTHMGLGPLEKPKTAKDFSDAPKGRMRWKKCYGERGNTPQQMWEKCFAKNDNLFVVFSGDQSRTQALRLVSPNERGKPVHELLSDYHQYWLRVNRFLPGKNRIEVYTIDSRDSRLCRGTEKRSQADQHCFTLDYDMSVAPRGNRLSVEHPAGAVLATEVLVR
ncbi:MAG: serine/threonine protein phosphatase [Verrucomicrobia bacterium]|nr:serine/threonine protein phosphatase [Verrucomicrobiota bacterium]